MNTWLFLLALACMILAPNNPVGLLVLFLVACLRVRRSSEMEADDTGSGDRDSPTNREDVHRDCELI